jgi:CubicO group peptidase (beta-lactamase class C family)
VYSATKAATATCAHLLAQRGELDLDTPAAHYWPEFAAQGKADIPVRWLLSHRAGLPVIDHPLPLADLLAWDPMAAERGRVSRMVIDDPPGAEVAAIPLDQIPEQFRGLVAAFTDPDSLMNRAFALSTPDIDFNDPEAQAAEIPSSNGICTADGLARLYAALIGEVDGVRILDAATLADAIAEQAFGPDRVLLVPSRFGSGFMLPTDEAPLGGPVSFGHPGRGGSLGFGDPESGIAFGYVVSHIRQDLNDNRAGLLVQAVRACLG